MRPCFSPPIAIICKCRDFSWRFNGAAKGSANSSSGRGAVSDRRLFASASCDAPLYVTVDPLSTMFAVVEEEQGKTKNFPAINVLAYNFVTLKAWRNFASLRFAGHVVISHMCGATEWGRSSHCTTHPWAFNGNITVAGIWSTPANHGKWALTLD